MKQKRKLFDELMEGVDAMQQQREGKITLRSHEVEDLPPLEVDADLIRDTRERMHVSRAVFARRLRVSTRTLGKLGARTGAAQCPGRCIDSDGEEISRYAGETQRVGQPGGMNVWSRAMDPTWERRQARLAILSSQFLTRVAWGYFRGHFRDFAF